MLDQDPDGHLVGEPDVGGGQAAIGDLPPEYLDVLSARVAEHIKVLRRKIADRGLAAADVRISDEVAVRILIEHGIITSADLSRLDDPAWRSRQEDLWWTQG